MAKITIFESLSLDGVMQAPGRPDEDRRGGFSHGGWATPYADHVMGKLAGEGMSGGGAMLFGRRTYEDFYGFWPHQGDNPYTEVLNNSRKYVVSRTLEDPLPWNNSTLLKGEAAQSVAQLKADLDQDLVVLGSGELVQALLSHGLIDTYILLIHPLVLGTGTRLFRDGNPLAKLRLVDTTPTTTGVIIATFQDDASLV
ncbi:deaminase [Rhizocola hellebori]|uniref:Deaminase n=1 Tax=Rhizocola hellebori TaxID=1392758 RepID=A0A8J3VHX5_9ACTN|nr:dihydrofolate reductase family protein [Rhizocola hellebori]GIH06732.1 deaminase [Rhizocola hellebori]